MRSRAPLALSLAGLACLAHGCGLGLTGLGPSSGDGSGPGDAAGADTAASGDTGPQVDEGGEAATPDGAQDPATTLVPIGPVASGTGLAQQTHVFYATGSARWWLLWIDATQPQQLQATSSPDFVAWTPATPLALPASLEAQGGDFSAAYASLGGTDVVHVSLGVHFAAQDRRHFHARATIEGAAILWSMPQQMTQVTDPALVDPDGPATAIGPDGFVWESSGWAQFNGTGNETVWESTTADPGTGWDGIFGLAQNVATGMTTVNARGLYPAGAPSGPLALWELADQEPDPTNVAWSQRGGLGWGPPGTVFPAGKTQSANDWDAVQVSASDLRAVRRAVDGSFDHASYDGTKWTALPAPDTDPGLIDTGVVTLSDGPRVAVVAIGGDPAQSVRMTEWDGVAWGAWKTLDGAPAVRTALSGWSSGGRTAVVWTESSADAGPPSIAGMLVQL